MATAMAGTPQIKLEYGRPETIALKFTTGKNFDGTFGPRVMFTAADERKLWLDPEDGSDLERRLGELGVRPGDPITLTKIKMPHGGGHALRCDRADATPQRVAPQRAETPRRTPAGADLVPALEASLAVVETRKAEIDGRQPVTPISAKFMAALCCAVDCAVEAQAYATRRGLAISFSAEDVRAIAATIVISHDRAAGGR